MAPYDKSGVCDDTRDSLWILYLWAACYEWLVIEARSIPAVMYYHISETLPSLRDKIQRRICGIQRRIYGNMQYPYMWKSCMRNVVSEAGKKGRYNDFIPHMQGDVITCPASGTILLIYGKHRFNLCATILKVDLPWFCFNQRLLTEPGANVSTDSKISGDPVCVYQGRSTLLDKPGGRKWSAY